MLQRLEAADDLAELAAVFQVLRGAGERFLANAAELGCHRRASDIQDAIEQRPAVVDLAEHGVGVDVNLIERQACSVVGVDHHRALGQKALRFGVDQEQRQAGLFARRARRAGGDDVQIRNMAIDDEGFGAGEREAVAGALGFEREPCGIVLAAFVDRERRDQSSGSISSAGTRPVGQRCLPA